MDLLTGVDGIKQKNMYMAAVTNYMEVYNVDTDFFLNKTRVVIRIDAMNAGVSSD